VDTLPESRNVIPDRVVVALDWRVLPGDEDELLVRRIREGLERRIPEVPEGFGLEVRMASEVQRTYTGHEETKSLMTPGYLLEAEHPVVRAATRAVGLREDPSSPARSRPWRFATDGGWSCGVHGIPTIGFAPGEERFAHTNRERLDVEEARWAFERHPALITAVQRALTAR